MELKGQVILDDETMENLKEQIRDEYNMIYCIHELIERMAHDIEKRN